MLKLLETDNLRIPITCFPKDKCKFTDVKDKVYAEYEDGKGTRVAGFLGNDMTISVETMLCPQEDFRLIDTALIPALLRASGTGRFTFVDSQGYLCEVIVQESSVLQRRVED